MTERFFVTGATGCIGGWVVKNLVESGCEVSALARGGNLDRLRLIMSDANISKVHIVKGDIGDGGLLNECVVNNRIQYVIHLAAMQLPLCQADPWLGACVNVGGTVNIFETAKKNGIRSVVYSSSTAVYGKKEEYESGRYGHHSPFSLILSLYLAFEDSTFIVALQNKPVIMRSSDIFGMPYAAIN